MKKVLLSGLMLMSFFFGAGNLIFPPTVGLNSGDQFLAAISGFNLSAVVIPFLTLLAVALSGDSAISLSGRVGKVYGLVFTVVIIFSIGPLFGIPRVADVSYDLGVKPLLQGLLGAEELPVSSPVGLVYVVLFFVLSYFLALFGDKLLDTIGKYLSPALVIFMVLLVVVFMFSGHEDTVGKVSAGYTESAFAKGALDGYNTLDAIAAVAFAGLVVNSLKPTPNTPSREVVPDVIKAGVISCVLLALIYLSLAYLGNVTAESGQTGGAEILVYAAHVAFGSSGQWVFAIIVFLACITTSVGLLKTISNYSYRLFGGLSENAYLLVFTLVSALLSVQGLSSVIKTSIPMILLTYPITISLVLVTLFNSYVKERAYVYFFVALFVTPVAFADAFRLFSENYFGKSIDLLGVVRDFIPFGNTDFTWIAPLVLGVVVGMLFPAKKVNTIYLNENTENN